MRLTRSPRSGIHFRVERELTIESLVQGGDGLARDDGRVVFLPLVAPGDRVRARLTQDKGVWRGEVLELLAPGPARVEPECPLVGTCGGCQWQQIEYAAQLSAKEAAVREALERVGRLDASVVKTIVPSPRPVRYRRRLRAQLVGKGWGFSRKGSHIADRADACLLVEEAVEALADEVAPLLKAAALGAVKAFALDVLESGRGALHVELADKPTRSHAGRVERIVTGVRALEGALITGGSGKPMQVGDPTLVDENHFGLRVRPDLFAQANRLGARALAAHVVAQVPEGAKVLELFAGAGTLTLAYESKAGELVVSEGEGPSLELLRLSLGEKQRAARFEPGAAATVTARLASSGERFDHLVLDPPRAGVREAVDAIARLQAPTVTWVACDAATFARDAARMVAQGYVLKEVVPFDLFPQTHHVELVARFRR